MVFKKPYAFLIKYFKLINFVLALLAGYIIYKTYSIVSFFNDFIISNYSGNFFAGFYKDYTSSFVFLVIFLILVGLAGVTLLFVYKKKPNKTYISSIVYYIILIIFLMVVKNLMISMERDLITAESARVYRDLSLLLIVPQVIFFVLFLIRGFGLNIEKFNFKEDLKELEISSEDSEEIEITIRKDDIKLKRNLHRLVREFIYYVKENKFIFSIIAVVGSVLLIYGIYNIIPKGVNTNFSQGDSFNYQGIYYELQDSIVTNLDYKGDLITNKDTYYVVVRIKIKNQTDDSYKIDFNKFRLELDNTYLYPDREKLFSFIDYAKDSVGSELQGNSENIYAIIYKIKEKEIKRNYRIKVENGSAIVNKKLVGKYNYFTINPIKINEVAVEGNYKLKDEINFINSNLKNTTLTLDNLVITDRYNYNYESCIDKKCTTYKDSIGINYTRGDRTLIILDAQFKMDETIPFYNPGSELNKFLNNFATVRYVEDKEEKETTITNVTPENMKDKIALETSDKIKNSETLKLVFTIRNKEYIVNLK